VSSVEVQVREEGRGVRGRFGRFWQRHRSLFWALHSVWALATGVAVIFLARERYGFVPWVVLFLALTWASTLFFARRAAVGAAGRGAAPATPGFGVGFTSYVTRSLFQETLFFLLPFYAYSTVLRSPNVVFLLLLSGLALFSCIDLVFDRWMRTKPLFVMLFFASVAFAALNLLLPLLFGMSPTWGTRLAALLALGSAIPLVGGVGQGRARDRAAPLVAGALALVVVFGAPRLIPPVPLRMQSAAFATDIDRGTFALANTLSGAVTPSEVGDRLVVLVEVFAPSAVPTGVRFEWRRGGQTLRTSREIQIVAHGTGFRVWDVWTPPSGPVPPGRYELVLRTGLGQVFGVARLEVAGP